MAKLPGMGAGVKLTAPLPRSKGLKPDASLSRSKALPSTPAMARTGALKKEGSRIGKPGFSKSKGK